MKKKRLFLCTIPILAVLFSIVGYAAENQIQYARIYVDSTGESHFENLDIKLTPFGSGPQALSLSSSSRSYHEAFDLDQGGKVQGLKFGGYSAWLDS